VADQVAGTIEQKAVIGDKAYAVDVRAGERDDGLAHEHPVNGTLIADLADNGLFHFAVVVSEMLGHSSVALTLDTYSHVIGGLQRTVVKKLDALLNAELRQNPNISKN